MTRTISVYKYVQDVDDLSTFDVTASFTGPGKLEPLEFEIQETFDDAGAFDEWKLYTDYMGLENGDKVTIDGTDYIANGIKKNVGLLRSFTSCIIKEKYD